jgi:hypothetical protein
MSAAAKILDRVAAVKQTGAGRWIARCPAHEDKSPSLSIREMDDGRVLLHCFAGCAVGDVLAAVGLQFSDLFDKPLAHHWRPLRGGFSARELLELNSHESTVVELLAEKVAAGGTLTPQELQRLRGAAARLGRARAMTHG